MVHIILLLAAGPRPINDSAHHHRVWHRTCSLTSRIKFLPLCDLVAAIPSQVRPEKTYAWTNPVDSAPRMHIDASECPSSEGCKSIEPSLCQQSLAWGWFAAALKTQSCLHMFLSLPVLPQRASLDTAIHATSNVKYHIHIEMQRPETCCGNGCNGKSCSVPSLRLPRLAVSCSRPRSDGRLIGVRSVPWHPCRLSLFSRRNREPWRMFSVDQ